jgi:hypothetical protein
MTDHEIFEREMALAQALQQLYRANGRELSLDQALAELGKPFEA